MYYKVASSHLPAPQLVRVLKPDQVASSHLPAPQLLRVLKLRHKVASSQLPAPQLAPLLNESHSRLHFAHSTRTISAQGCAVISQIALSPAFRALTHDLRRGLRGNFTNRALACISRTRHARSPQRVARAPDESRSRLHFAHSTRTISAEGCARTRQIALSPAFRALDTHERGNFTNRALACISRTQHTISAEGCAVISQIALSPAFRALDARNLLQRVARTPDESRSRLHFAHTTRTISAEVRAHTGRIALSPAFRLLDAHDLRRGLHFRLTLFVPPSAFKREFIKRGKFFIRTSPVLVTHCMSSLLITLAYSLHVCILIACLHAHH